MLKRWKTAVKGGTRGKTSWVEIKTKVADGKDGSPEAQASKLAFNVFEDGGVVGRQPLGESEQSHHHKVRDIVVPGVPIYPIPDPRASPVFIEYFGGSYWCHPSAEPFSGRTGTCELLGNKKALCQNYTMKVGDFLRLGSVGLVVSAINTGDESTTKVLTTIELETLKSQLANAAKLDLSDDEEATAVEDLQPESDRCDTADQVCYICYEGSVERNNPLVSPCRCKGDTKFVHVQCLQKWNDNSGNGLIVSVTSADGFDICSVCKTQYQTSVRLSDGRVVSLLAAKLPPPYITFVVVTRHSKVEKLTNAHFQVSFSGLLDSTGTSGSRPVLVGRSSTCDMVLSYRTVSTTHAQIQYRQGQFILNDLQSSNGTLLYIRKPIELDYGRPTLIKIGRTILSLRPRRSWRMNFRPSGTGDSPLPLNHPERKAQLEEMKRKLELEAPAVSRHTIGHIESVHLSAQLVSEGDLSPPVDSAASAVPLPQPEDPRRGHGTMDVDMLMATGAGAHGPGQAGVGGASSHPLPHGAMMNSGPRSMGVRVSAPADDFDRRHSSFHQSSSSGMVGTGMGARGVDLGQAGANSSSSSGISIGEEKVGGGGSSKAGAVDGGSSRMLSGHLGALTHLPSEAEALSDWGGQDDEDELSFGKGKSAGREKAVTARDFSSRRDEREYNAEEGMGESKTSEQPLMWTRTNREEGGGGGHGNRRGSLSSGEKASKDMDGSGWEGIMNAQCGFSDDEELKPSMSPAGPAAVVLGAGTGMGVGAGGMGGGGG